MLHGSAWNKDVMIRKETVMAAAETSTTSTSCMQLDAKVLKRACKERCCGGCGGVGAAGVVHAGARHHVPCRRSLVRLGGEGRQGHERHGFEPRLDHGREPGVLLAPPEAEFPHSAWPRGASIMRLLRHPAPLGQRLRRLRGGRERVRDHDGGPRLLLGRPQAPAPPLHDHRLARPHASLAARWGGGREARRII